MKKTLTFILTAMAFLALALPASAADNYYFVPEYDMLYSLPDWFDVISRETPQDSPLFAKYGTTYEEQMADFAEKDRYCYAMWPEKNIGISLTIYDEEMDIPDYNSLTDERLEKYIDLYINMYEDGGYTVIGHSIYNSPQMKYVCLEYTAQGWYALRYNCYYQGHNYEINIISRQPADRTTRLALRNMADSCYIQSFSYRNPIDTDIPPTTYTDSRYGLSFTLPANWQIGNDDPDIEYVDAIFNYPADSFVCMTYGSLDLYAMLSPEEQSLGSRQEFDIAYLDEIEMLEYLMTAFPEGVSAREVHSVTYNGCEYFQIDMDVTLPGLPVVQHLTSMYTVKNGIAYTFGLYGSENSRYFEDLESLLQTVSYPGTAGATLTDSFINGALSGLLFALLAVVLRIIFSAISGKKQKNKGETAVASAPAAPYQSAVSPQPAPQKTAKAPQQSPQPAAESTVYCHSCGSPNPKGNSYCINCGTKLADFSEEINKGTAATPPKAENNTHSICDTSRSVTAQYDRVSEKAELCHSETQRAEESHPLASQGQTRPISLREIPLRRYAAHKGNALPHSICDTSRSATAQYDRVGEKVEFCHSEAQRAEESHQHKSRTLPHNICDTSQSATAQYDSARVLLCHSEAQCAEESHQHKSRTLTHIVCDTSQSATAQYDRVGEKAENYPAPQPTSKIKVKAVKAKSKNTKNKPEDKTI